MLNLFSNFYQMGFVARDLDAGLQALANSHGMRRFRRTRPSLWMESAHAWVGSTMIEVIVVDREAPAHFRFMQNETADEVRLHHHGFRVFDEVKWNDIKNHVNKLGFDVPISGSYMNGNLNYIYADTRKITGIYSEYVYLTGSAIDIYKDVPQND